MDNLQIFERREGVVTVLDLRGNIRLGQDNIDLHRALGNLVNRGDRRIILNLSEIKYIDSTGLGELIAGYTSLRKNHGDLKIINLTDRVRELMVITKLLTVFEVFDDEAEAIASFGFNDFGKELVTGPLDSAVAAVGEPA